MVFPERESMSAENVNRTSPSDVELAQLHGRLSELEKNPRWRHRCFFIHFMFATGTKPGEVLPLRLKDLLSTYDPPIAHVPDGPRSRYIQVN